MPGQPNANSMIQHLLKAIFRSILTREKKKRVGIFTPTPASWMTGIFVIFGLVFWAIMGSMADDPHVDIFTIYLMNGLAYSCWAGFIVSAIHSVEKALN